MTNGNVYAMTVVGDTLYVGGTFTAVLNSNGTFAYSVKNLAAFNLTTGEGIPTWKPAVTNSAGTAAVRALAPTADGTTLYVGGQFDAIDGQPRLNLGAVSPQMGTVSSFAPSVGTSSSFVWTILPSAEKIYFGGEFVSVNGVSRLRLAAVSPAGTLDTAWKPRANTNVRSLTFAADGQTIFIGGRFSAISGVSRQSVARVATSNGALDPWQIPPGTIENPMVAWDLLATPTRLYGGFGAGPNYAAAFRLDNGTDGSRLWRFGTAGNVQKVVFSPTTPELFIGGHFGTGNLQHRVCGNTINLRALGLLGLTFGNLNCLWVPQLAPWGNNYQGVWALQTTPTHIWVGGRFTTINGITQKYLARFAL